MKVKRRKKSIYIRLLEFLGCKERTEDDPLPIDNITFEFCKIGDLMKEEYIGTLSDELRIPTAKIKGELQRMTADLRQDLSCCIEYPYVDMYYRDTYYNYYAKKHKDYNRYCFRISFFDEDVKYENFHTMENLSEKFYGYIVLRPTIQRATGYSFLSPKAYMEHDFVCCIYKRKVSVYGRKLHVYGFPFCGQDGEMITCAETSLIMMLDYFSHKYSKYSEILPSGIIQILSQQTNERQLPSKGLPSDMIPYVLQKLGLGIRTHYRNKAQEAYKDEEFKKLLYVYIESGLPIQISTKEHSFVVIGKENKLGTENVKLVSIDDNQRPYKLIDFNENIVSFSVPLYEKIFLEADAINIRKVQEILEQKFKGLETHINEEGYQGRLFVTSSRSYKNYVCKMNAPYSREHFLCMAMPRFIWVYEVIKTADIDHQTVEQTPITSVFLFDATEGIEAMNYFIMAKTEDCIILKTTDNSMYRKTIYKKFDGNSDTFTIFANNLKGNYNKWQES